MRVEATVQLGIAVPPLPSLRPGPSWDPCKKVQSTVQAILFLELLEPVIKTDRLSTILQRILSG